MMHSDSNPSIKGIIRIGFLSTLCLCLIWTHQAYASSTHTPDAANDGLSGDMISHNDWETRLPFDFLLPILFP